MKDSVLAAIEFEKAGIDLLDISGGLCGDRNPTNEEQGYFSEITEAIKQNISIPVILTGGIKDIHVAEKLIEENKAKRRTILSYRSPFIIGNYRSFLFNSQKPNDSLEWKSIVQDW